VLNFFAPAPGRFTDTVIKEAEEFARVAGSTLRLAIRIEAAEHLNIDLKAAMATRKIIDAACGLIMAQNRCGHDEAFNLLVKASSHRNQKLHDVAVDIIARMGLAPNHPLHFDD
jgi:hypothetical protein